MGIRQMFKVLQYAISYFGILYCSLCNNRRKPSVSFRIEYYAYVFIIDICVQNHRGNEFLFGL